MLSDDQGELAEKRPRLEDLPRSTVVERELDPSFLQDVHRFAEIATLEQHLAGCEHQILAGGGEGLKLSDRGERRDVGNVRGHSQASPIHS